MTRRHKNVQGFIKLISTSSSINRLWYVRYFYIVSGNFTNILTELCKRPNICSHNTKILTVSYTFQNDSRMKSKFRIVSEYQKMVRCYTCNRKVPSGFVLIGSHKKHLLRVQKFIEKYSLASRSLCVKSVNMLKIQRV